VLLPLYVVLSTLYGPVGALYAVLSPLVT
jgi:hypothetical protein